MNPVQDSFSYLIGTVIDIFMLLVLLRFLFQFLSINFRNPIVGPIVKLTQWPLSMLRRFVPGLFGIDLSALVLLIVLGLLKIYVLSFMVGHTPALGMAVVSVIASILDMTFSVFYISIIAQAVLSWFASRGQTPFGMLLDEITRPILMPIRRILPSMGGFDLSPMVAFIALRFLQKLVVSPMLYYASGVM